MNEFESVIATYQTEGLCSLAIETIQANLGLRCNQQCLHCHLNCSPQRTELMEWFTMEKIAEVAAASGCKLVDLTGGAPELNPRLTDFISLLRKQGLAVQVRTNLTVLLEPGLEELADFFRNHQVKLVASLPCYLESNVDHQRGEQVYHRSITVLKQLNRLGYGIDPELSLDLVYNPGTGSLPPAQAELEENYRVELKTRHQVQFTNLLTITNLPVGRFREQLDQENGEAEYIKFLQNSFNHATLDGLMCRHQISVGWDGSLYDCDFNLALGLRVNHSAPTHIDQFNPAELTNRQIVTGNHCFGCTAGSGSSCGGALL